MSQPIGQPVQPRAAIVTGANHGLGAAIARRLAADGFGVLVAYQRIDANDHPNADGFPSRLRDAWQASGDTVAQEINACGGRAHALEANLAQEPEVLRLCNEAERLVGELCVLVHAASAWRADALTDSARHLSGCAVRVMTAASFDAQIAVDARAAALLIAEFARRHRSRKATWGRIITLSSDGTEGFPGEVSYGAAKAALESITFSAAHELGPLGITANVVRPAPTDTGWIPPELIEHLAAHSPLRRVAEPGDTADMVSFLVSEQARAVTANRLTLR
jgi:3-oxoacyl-[acyl-carrier protein] reductase